MSYIKDRAREVIDVFYAESDRPPSAIFNIHKLIKAISTVTGYKIAHLSLPGLQMPDLRGMLLPFKSGQAFCDYIDRHDHLRSHCNQESLDPNSEKTALILLSNSQINNACWQRFTVIKEAAHLLIEPDLVDSNDVTALAQVLANTHSFGQYETLPEKEKELYARESSGILAAMELLIPEVTHKELIEAKVRKEKQTPYQVANSLRLPQKYIEHRMNEWGIPLL